MAATIVARLTRVNNVLESISRCAAELSAAHLLEARGKRVQDMDTEEFEAFRKAQKERRAAANEKRKAKAASDRVKKKLTLPPAKNDEPEQRPVKGAAALSKLRKKVGGKFTQREGKAEPVADNVEKLGRVERKLKTLAKDRGDQVQKPKVPVGRQWNMRRPRGEAPGEFKAAQEKKVADLDWHQKEWQRRGLGRGRIGDHDYVPAALKAKASKLRRLRMAHPAHRDRDHDDAKGYNQYMDPKGKVVSAKEHPKWKRHYVDSSGKLVHASGKKENKKFANATTFRDSDTDALLHTDRSKDGARADADIDEFVFHGDVKKDPRQKWYRVSKEGGYASAMASLGKAYHKDPKVRSKVIAKIKKTGFVDAKGHQIDVKPTGALHDERGPCMRNKKGALTRVGKELKRQNPQEWSRLCKGAHGPSGTPSRNEYNRGFSPRYDDVHKLHKLHKAAEAGKADRPNSNIKAHMAARPGRRQDVHDIVQSIGRKATRVAWHMRNA